MIIEEQQQTIEQQQIIEEQTNFHLNSIFFYIHKNFNLQSNNK